MPSRHTAKHSSRNSYRSSCFLRGDGFRVFPWLLRQPTERMDYTPNPHEEPKHDQIARTQHVEDPEADHGHPSRLELAADTRRARLKDALDFS